MHFTQLRRQKNEKVIQWDMETLKIRLLEPQARMARLVEHSACNR